MEKKNNFWLSFSIALIALIATFFIVSFVLSKVHEVNMVEEWQLWANAIKNWLDSLKTVKDASAVIKQIKI